MIAGFANALRQHGNTDDTGPRTGIISSYDPGSGVKVKIQPEDRETNWIQLDCPGVGNGWGVQIGPQIGDEVTVSFESNDPNLGKVTARHANSNNLPMPVPSGEIWMVHKSGSLLKFHNDGSVEIKAAAGMAYTATVHQFHGPITTDSTITAAGDVVAGTVSLENHLHNGGTISGKTSAPIP
ncbi:baseplate assembly protein [Pseudomonas fluorescens HK44]|uniref:Baseplate assembly protein n=1 Tax=Pseudomonas fluorescens HK44 TaxID=1042209 RepID=A0A010S5G8_PSEFL|nr:phage baseplate assembly protein V [Pseudomonas fluorescens]EXF95809.1 baseplate assembly protein [Pseudomonas fluorescens HK44]